MEVLNIQKGGEAEAFLEIRNVKISYFYCGTRLGKLFVSKDINNAVYPLRLVRNKNNEEVEVI